MNQTPETLQKDGVLEITVKEGTITKEHVINAYRVNGNGHWKYIRSNGQKLGKQTTANPKEFAEALKIAYANKNLQGEIYWRYNSQS